MTRSALHKLLTTNFLQNQLNSKVLTLKTVHFFDKVP